MQILRKLDEQRLAESDSDEEHGGAVRSFQPKPHIPPPQLPLNAHRPDGPPPPLRACQRPLLCPAGGEDGAVSKIYFHQGLHSTGTVFVSPVDSSNAREFFSGRASFKVCEIDFAETRSRLIHSLHPNRLPIHLDRVRDPMQ